jgi:teichuronic acid biosynthesis glycosyltransferase TuaC
MKILSISHMFPNQINPNYGVFVKERIKYISKQLNLITVAPLPYFPANHFFEKYSGLNRVEKKENYDSLQVYHPKYFCIPKYLKFLDGYFYFYSLNNFIDNILNTFDADLLDLHWVYPDAFAGLNWARRHKKKIVVTIRGNESICYFEKSLRKKMLINTLKCVDHIISVSSDLKQKIVEKYGIDENAVTVIPNGIDDCKFYAINKEKARRKNGLELDKQYVLSLCRLSEEKGLEYLLRAFSRIKRDNNILLMVGDGPLEKRLKDLSQKLNISNRVKFIGAVSHDETIWWYNAADVYCLPSLWEGCPNVIIESLACGTPVVATQVGGIPDLIPDKKFGYLVPPGNDGELADALSKALVNDWERTEIARFGASNTWQNVADSVIKVFKRVLNKGE